MGFSLSGKRLQVHQWKGKIIIDHSAVTTFSIANTAELVSYGLMNSHLTNFQMRSPLDKSTSDAAREGSPVSYKQT